MSGQTNVIGLDIGYGDTKAACDNGQSVCFPSLVAPAEFIRFQADVGASIPLKGTLLRDTEEGDLFIGELAARQGRPGAVRSPRDRDRVADAIMTHLADAALAMLLPNVEYAAVKIVTGLPVDYYRDAEALATHLRGQHSIKLEGRRLSVDVEEVKVVPQPFGGLLSVLLDERGKLMADAAHLVQGRVGVLDVGMYTTDLILVDGLEYIEAGSGSLEVGVSTVLEMLRKVLLDDYRVSYEPHQIEVALRRGWLVINGQNIKLNGLASDRLSVVAQSIEARPDAVERQHTVRDCAGGRWVARAQAVAGAVFRAGDLCSRRSNGKRERLSALRHPPVAVGPACHGVSLGKPSGVTRRDTSSEVEDEQVHSRAGVSRQRRRPD